MIKPVRVARMMIIVLVMTGIFALEKANAETVGNCGFVNKRKIEKVEVHIFTDKEKKDTYFMWRGQKYVLNHEDKIANAIIGFTDPYKADDGSITEAQLIVENGLYLAFKDYNTQDYSNIIKLECSKK
jgi:hypothetical protein